MSYGFEWIPEVSFVGAVVVFLIVPPFALIGLMVVAMVALVALVVLAGAVLTTPYLLVRFLYRRFVERRHPTERTARIASAIAQTARATNRSGVAALTEPTTARSSQ
jgi:hypothetical protein